MTRRGVRLTAAERQVYDALERSLLAVDEVALWWRDLLPQSRRRWDRCMPTAGLRRVLLSLQSKLDESGAPLRLYTGLPYAPTWMLAPPLTGGRREVQERESENACMVRVWPEDLAPPRRSSSM